MSNNSFCIKCGLYEGINSPMLMGRGDENPELLIIGEAPGENEDLQGQVFIGSSGQELEGNLISAGFSGVKYRIENAVKCRPTKDSTDRKGNLVKSNRTPTAKEVSYCKPHTIKLILQYKPKVIVTLGAIPLSQLLTVDISQNLARGRVYYHPQLECYIIPTYHPAYLLRTHDAQHKKEFISDLKLAKEMLALGPPRKLPKKPKSLNDPLEIKEYLTKLKSVKEFSCDLETTGLNYLTDRITDINLCCAIGEGVHIEWQNMLPFYEDLQNVMLDKSIAKVFHNGKFDIKMLRAVGIKVRNYAFDTMTGYHTLTMSFEGEGKGLYSLKNLSWLLTTEGGYESVLDEFGGIANYQKIKHDPTAIKKAKERKEKVAKEKVVKEKKLTPKAAALVKSPDINSTELFTPQETILSTEATMEWILERFKHVVCKHDTAMLDKFAENSRAKKVFTRVPVEELDGVEIRELDLQELRTKTDIPVKDKIDTPVKAQTRQAPAAPRSIPQNIAANINISFEEELQKYNSYVEDKIKDEIASYDLKPIEYYSAMDADVTLRCKYKIEAELKKNPKQEWLYHNLVMPLSNTLLRLEENGLLLDFDHMNKVRADNEAACDKIRKKLFDKAGYEFNIDSNDDLRNFIYGHLKIPVDPNYMTAGGKSGNKKPSTDAEAIEHFSKKYPILKHIVEFRSLQKETSTYIDGWMKLADPNTHRVHPSYLQHTTATGRLSSAGPNAQNIPRIDKIRNMVIAPEGWKLVSCDLSQAELRILALMSSDERMLEAFRSGMDFHASTACLMFRINPKDFNKEDHKHAEYRTICKTINFGVAYGRGAGSIAEQLNISLQEAQNFVDTFFKTYKQAKQWMDDTQAFALKHGYVETLHGRRRYLPAAFSSNEGVRARALRQAINTPIQGTASDCACFGLIRMQDYLDEQPDLKSMPIGIVHDEILVEAPDAEVPTVVDVLPKFMTQDLPMVTIPLESDAKVLQKWSK